MSELKRGSGQGERISICSFMEWREGFRDGLLPGVESREYPKKTVDDV